MLGASDRLTARTPESPSTKPYAPFALGLVLGCQGLDKRADLVSNEKPKRQGFGEAARRNPVVRRVLQLLRRKRAFWS